MSTKTKATADVAEIKPKCVNAIFVVADDHLLVKQIQKLTRSVSSLFFQVMDECKSRVWSGVRGKYVGLQRCQFVAWQIFHLLTAPDFFTSTIHCPPELSTSTAPSSFIKLNGRDNNSGSQIKIICTADSSTLQSSSDMPKFAMIHEVQEGFQNHLATHKLPIGWGTRHQ